MKPQHNKQTKNKLWSNVSVSFLPSDLKELKSFIAITPYTFSSYVRQLVDRDKNRRRKITMKIQAKLKGTK